MKLLDNRLNLSPAEVEEGWDYDTKRHYIAAKASHASNLWQRRRRLEVEIQRLRSILSMGAVSDATWATMRQIVPEA